MKTLIENYINGNLSDAKRQAKRYSARAIIHALRRDYGFSLRKAMATEAYLKGYGSFQEACDTP